MLLPQLVLHLRQSLGILHKQDIQTAAQYLQPIGYPTHGIRLGDDCAAIPDSNNYLLLAAEGLLPEFLDADPWFAGWCAVMVNVSDVYAMGGYPIAIVDTLWSQTTTTSQPIWKGLQDAAQAYQVPIVGGHTNSHSIYNALSVAILGRANRLITSFNAQLGDRLLMVVDVRGQLHPQFSFWNAATHADPTQLREDLAILPSLAESGQCDAGKDISMGGLVGTLLMLMETSGYGAVLDLDQVPIPGSLNLETWLLCFPSYGFLLSVRPKQVESIQATFRQRELVCEPVGTVVEGQTVFVRSHHECLPLWNLAAEPLTGIARELKEM
jgi:AIR synthase-related protein